MILTIGADPEVFVRLEDKFISGHTFPCGSKEFPRKLDSGSVQVDGLALEFNVLPSETRGEFVDNTIKIYRDLNSLVKSINPRASLEAIPTVVFGEEYLKSLPKEVSRLGCNPDFNAYTMSENPVPDSEQPFRTGAGHVHIGFTKDADPSSMEHLQVCSELTKELDYFLGLPSLAWDSDEKRRSLYGKPGAFRPKSYGMEYRVLSNAWLRSRSTMEIVYDQTVRCVARKFSSKKKPLYEKYGDLAKTLINENQVSWMKGYQKVSNDVFN